MWPEVTIGVHPPTTIEDRFSKGMLRKAGPSGEKVNESLNLAYSYLAETRQVAGSVQIG